MSNIGYPPPFSNYQTGNNYTAEQAAAESKQAEQKVMKDTVENNWKSAFMKDVTDGFRSAKGQ